MSESSAPNYGSPGSPMLGQPRSLLRIGGALGIAAVSISLIIFTVGCFGFYAVFRWLPLIPMALSLPGIVLSIIGALKKTHGDEDTQVMASLFTNILAFAGALLEVSIWLNWGLFYQQAK